MSKEIHNTAEYKVKDTCLAIWLFNGNMIFADEVVFHSTEIRYVPRGEKSSVNYLHLSIIDKITVGIYEI